MPTPFFSRVYDVVRQIPAGQVATYGQVAAVVGPEATARDIGDAMAALRHNHPDPPVPWQRVINAQGRVSTGERQQALLEQEAVIFNQKGQTNLQHFGWDGPDPTWAKTHGYYQLEKSKPTDQQLDLF